MTFAYLIACHKAFGLIPFGFHLMNLALHIAVVLLVFAVAERLFRDRLLSLIAAGLFALHPIYTESVAWIAGITDLELSVFFLLTFLLYLRLSESESSAAPSWLSYIPILIAYLFCLLSKEQALVLPALLIVYEQFLSSLRRRDPIPQKVPSLSAAVFGGGGLPRLPPIVLGGFAPAIWRPGMPWSSVMLSAIALIGGYLWELLWPAHLYGLLCLP